jgi:NAD(P)-dependent dehydrogenase (short-subunit alcohol dehydrogenase family)
MSEDLAGRVAVVTGGASGIGDATVRRLHRAGASVVIADVDRDRGQNLAASLGSRATFCATDVAEAAQVEVLVARAVEVFGGLDIMVNNAAVSSPLLGLLDDELTDFHRIMGVNVLGVMLGTRHAGRYMADHGGGAIINMSSIGGIQAGPKVTVYRASKAAVIHFTKGAAIELAPYDITVNAIAPGNIPTPLLASSATDQDAADIGQFETTIRDQMRASRPLQRDGTTDDIADAVHYLASPSARYITGIVLPIDGGIVAGTMGLRPVADEKPGPATEMG